MFVFVARLLWATGVWLCCRKSTDPRWEPLQRTKEFCESFVPGVRVIQVTGMPRPLHHHHSVIGQISQVWERKLPKLSVLVAIDNQSWNLVRQRVKTLLMSNFQSFSFKREAKEFLKLKKKGSKLRAARHTIILAFEKCNMSWYAAINKSKEGTHKFKKGGFKEKNVAEHCVDNWVQHSECQPENTAWKYVKLLKQEKSGNLQFSVQLKLWPLMHKLQLRITFKPANLYFSNTTKQTDDYRFLYIYTYIYRIYTYIYIQLSGSRGDVMSLLFC